MKHQTTNSNENFRYEQDEKMERLLQSHKLKSVKAFILPEGEWIDIKVEHIQGFYPYEDGNKTRFQLYKPKHQVPDIMLIADIPYLELLSM